MPPKPKPNAKNEPYKLKLPAVLANKLGHTERKTSTGSARQYVTKIQQRKNDRVQKRTQKDVARVSSIQQNKQSQQAWKSQKSHNPDTSDLWTGQVISSGGDTRSHSQMRHRIGRQRGNKHRKGPKKENESRTNNGEEDDEEDDEEEENGENWESDQTDLLDESTEAPKSILKRTKRSDREIPAANKLRSPTPPPKVHRAIKQKLEEDDAAIAALEKRLGIKGKKQPGYVKEDGLDDLLDGIDDLVGLGQDSDDDLKGKKRKRTEDEEWLANKRKKAGRIHEPTESDEESVDEEDMSGEDEFSGDDSLEDEDLESDEESDDDGFEGFDSDNSSSPQKHVRENPYVAPSTGNDQPSTKYIPPSLRKPSASDSEDLIRLRRQLQGLVNRLTDSNLISILGDVEKIYRNNARQHVTSTLVDLLLTSVCEPTSLPDTLIILPAGFIAAVYKIIGTDFGAQVTQRIVELFDEHYKIASELGNDGPDAATVDGKKETSNLITLLSELYNFQVVGSTLIFDYIRQFLGKLTELNAELLLRVIRISGPQLRQDDPSSLKDIVIMLRPAVASIGEANLSVRTKFMIETITDLKNNKMKTGAVTSAVVSEHHTRMKKTIGSLNTRSIKASEPLRISLKDIQDSDKKGKWWLVGASWAGNDTKTTDADQPITSTSTKSSKIKIKDIDNEPSSTDLIQLARDHRMNTDIRRSIFITIMSSSDYQDAHVRLLKLHLKRAQELEIPKVLLHCAAGEAAYNPYYMLIARKLCQSDRRLRKSFEFCCWDLFKRMGVDDEVEDEYDDSEGELEMREVVNIAKFYGNLVATNSISLTILKKLVPLNQLRNKVKIFAEILFITIFLEIGKTKEEKVIEKVFGAVKGVKGLGVGLDWFLRKVVGRSDVVEKWQRGAVSWGVGVARRVLIENED